MTCLIAIGGHTGTGKSTLGFALARACPVLRDPLVLDFDQVHRDLMGYDLSVVMTADDYAEEVMARVWAAKAEQAKAALRAGRDVIDVSGFFRDVEQREVETLALEAEASFVGLWLTLPLAEQKRRIEKRLAERALGCALSVEEGHASDACLGVIGKFGDIGQPEHKAWVVLDASCEKRALLAKVVEIIEQKIG